MKCKKCGSENLDVVKAGPHIKLVCRDCLAFQKFLKDIDRETFLALKRGNTIPSKCINCIFFHTGAACIPLMNNKDCAEFIPYGWKNYSYIDGEWRG